MTKLFFLPLLILSFAAASADSQEAPASTLENQAATPAQERIDSILASVNGEPISLLDVVLESGRDENKLAALFRGKDLQDEVKATRRKILDEIINRKLVYEDYNKEPFDVPVQYTEDMLDNLANELGDGTRTGLENKAKQYGTTMAELRDKARQRVIVDIMVSENCVRPSYITPKEVYDYYNSHISEFTQPAAVEMQLLLLKKDGRNKDRLDSLQDEIKRDTQSGNGKIFSSLVMLHSEGPNAEKGGGVGWIEESKLRPEFAAALKGFAPGAVAGPVSTPEGQYFIRLSAYRAAETKPYRELENELRKKLEFAARDKQYQSSAITFDPWLLSQLP